MAPATASLPRPSRAPLRASLALVGVLVLAALAVQVANAQPGPAPGMEPTDYAVGYAQQQAGEAQADPVGYAGGKASPEAAGAEAAHAAWLACWTVDDQGVDASVVCASYYTPPGEAQPPSEAEDVAANAVDGTVDNVTQLADDAVATVGEVLEDPTDAPGALERFLGAAGQTLRDIVGGLARAASALGGGVVDLLVATVDAVRDALGLGATTLQAAGLGVADAGVAGWDGLSTGLAAGAGGVADAATGAWDTVATGASDAGSALTGAADAVGSALSAAASAVGDAVSAAVDAVASLFGGGGSDAPKAAPVSAGKLPVEVDAGGLLDDVTGALPV